MSSTARGAPADQPDRCSLQALSRREWWVVGTSQIGEASPSWCNNVRLKAAPDGTLLAAWTGGNPASPENPDSFVRVWRRSPQGDWTDVSPPRMTKGRQFESDIAFIDLPQSAGGGYRAFLIFDDGNNVYATYSDPQTQGSWHEPVELVNSDTMNARLGIRDYWPSSLRALTFRYGAARLSTHSGASIPPAESLTSTRQMPMHPTGLTGHRKTLSHISHLFQESPT